MEKRLLTVAVMLALALVCTARRCPLLHAEQSANKTGCYIVVLKKATTPEKFTEILQRATSMADEHKVYGVVQTVSKAFTAKLSPYSLNVVRTYECQIYMYMCMHVLPTLDHIV